MKILPILFNTEMVKAILEGKKTRTRRLIPIQPDKPDIEMKLAKTTSGKVVVCFYREIPILDPANRTPFGAFQGPRYQPGDVLWVRETWTSEAYRYYYRADFESDFLDPCETLSGAYPATCIGIDCNFCNAQPERICWHPSIHMPKEAARIFLRVTNVQAKRLHDMTDRDAEEEGIGTLYLEDVGFGDKDYGCMKYLAGKGGYVGLQVEQFAHLWDSTIKKPDIPSSGWEANPWVWVYEFERIEKPEGWPNV